MSPGPGIARTVLPKGFFTSGVNCGVRRYRPDLGIILSEVDATVAGVFTRNEVKASPIRYCQGLLPSSRIRAIVTNSGQANAATGPEGDLSNLTMAQAVAQHLDCETKQVLTASTGVIGSQLAIDKIVAAIPELIERRTTIAEPFSLAILTTDLVPKTVTTTVELSKGVVTITGICKGSGMIHPNMGTMLGYLLTDAALSESLAGGLLRDVTDQSFNMISVDGDMSTNDCNFLMANGVSGVAIESEKDIEIFFEALLRVSQLLAQAIARDGEGATKLVEVQLKGSPDLELARRAARGVILSPLVKTAIHGEDPNWGRILARLGAEGVPSQCIEKMSLDIQGARIFNRGGPIAFDRSEVKGLLRQDKILLSIDLNSGDHQAVAWGCDLSKKYIEINTEYS